MAPSLPYGMTHGNGKYFLNDSTEHQSVPRCQQYTPEMSVPDFVWEGKKIHASAVQAVPSDWSYSIWHRRIPVQRYKHVRFLTADRHLGYTWLMYTKDERQNVNDNENGIIISG